MGASLGVLCMSPPEPQVIPNPSHGDVALAQPALGWQMKPPAIQDPESLPASHSLQFINFSQILQPQQNSLCLQKLPCA